MELETIADLNTLVADCSEFRELKRLLGKFNTFNVLEVENMEIRHSNILAWLLRPEESHGLGEQFLRNWLMLVSNEDTENKTPQPAEINSAHFKTVKVEKEEPFDTPTGKRYIDLLIKIEIDSRDGNKKEWVFCIENKVNSKQHTNQLTAYREYVSDEYKNHKSYFLLLSKNKEQPEGEETEYYVATTYELIQKSIEMSIQERSEIINAGPRQLIEDYLEILRLNFSDTYEPIRELSYKIYKRHMLAIDATASAATRNARNEVGQLSTLIYDSHKETIDQIVKHKPNNRDTIAEYLRNKISKDPDLENLKPNRNYFKFIPKQWFDVLLEKGYKDNSHPCLEIDMRSKSPKLKLVLALLPYDLVRNIHEIWKSEATNNKGFNCRIKKLKSEPNWATIENFKIDGVVLPEMNQLETNGCETKLWSGIQKIINQKLFTKRIELIRDIIESAPIPQDDKSASED